MCAICQELLQYFSNTDAVWVNITIEVVKEPKQNINFNFSAFLMLSLLS